MLWIVLSVDKPSEAELQPQAMSGRTKTTFADTKIAVLRQAKRVQPMIAPKVGVGLTAFVDPKIAVHAWGVRWDALITNSRRYNCSCTHLAHRARQTANVTTACMGQGVPFGRLRRR
jgi:hypothetical protein